MWIKDPKSKEPSVTLTVFVVGFVVATVKFLVAGLGILGLQVAALSGTDYAAAITALGAIYWARRNVEIGK
jgi:hypothetical protein